MLSKRDGAGDFSRPRCTRCKIDDVECIRDHNVRYKHAVSSGDGPSNAEYGFREAQRWVETAGDLRFLDETRELMSFYDHEVPKDYTETATPWTKLPAESPGVVQAQTEDEAVTADNVSSREGTVDGIVVSPSKRRRLETVMEETASSFVLSPSYTFGQSPGISWSRSLGDGITTSPVTHQDKQSHEKTPIDVSPRSATVHHQPAEALPGSIVGAHPNDQTYYSPQRTTSWRPTPSQHTDADYVTSPDTPGRLYLKHPVWPLDSLEEAKLLRYYVEHLARSFDLTDPKRHFRDVVPLHAGTCPTLLNAIFALAARHLSRVSDYDPLISDRYHTECIKHLIPMLDDSTAVLDESLYASAIILRHLEEIQVPLSGQTDQSHLMGAHIFMEAQVRATLAGGLREAAFWVGLRQEIFVAFVNQRTIMPAIDRGNFDRSFDTAADHVWSCRMVLLCADVIRYCFNDNDLATRTYRDLLDSVTEWNNRKPSTFTPVYHETPGLNAFPALWFLRDEINVGLQHYHIAQILLIAHDPKVPRIGPGRAAALRKMDDDIKEHVRVLCGICQSNPDLAPNYTYAAMAITIAGDKFTDPGEQNALLHLLDVCDKRHAHPTGRAQDNLKAAWGWT